MRFIEHIIEPTKLLLAWQSFDTNHRTRYIVGEFNLINNDVTLTYLTSSNDFTQANEHGFQPHTAFQSTSMIHHNVLDAFMRRLPPRTREDFNQYLEGLRLKPNAQLSDFALLGYSGAKLPSDGFSIIHPFNQVNTPCELLLEAAGYQYADREITASIEINQPACFIPEINDVTNADAIRIEVNKNHIGYVNRGLIPTFMDWIKNKRITGAWVEKKNGTPDKPAIYIYVQVATR